MTQVFDVVPFRINVHSFPCSCRCFFSEVEGSDLPILREDDHEAAAPDIAGGRMHNGERKSRCNRRVDGIASPLHHLYAHLGGERVRRNDHAVPRSLGWLRSSRLKIERRDEQSRNEEDEESGSVESRTGRPASDSPTAGQRRCHLSNVHYRM